MLRIVTAILICLTFLAFGGLGEILQYVFHLNSAYPLPWISQIFENAFPINEGRFLESMYPFCAAIFIVLLLTFQNPPVIKPDQFLNYSFPILLIFGLYCWLSITALLLPYVRLLAGMSEYPPVIPITWTNICFSIANVVLWLAALFLLIRFFVKRAKRDDGQKK